VHRYLFIAPARRTTEVFQERAVEYQTAVTEAQILVANSLTDQAFAPHGSLIEPSKDSLELARFSVTAAIVALHVINIYLILSGPVGQILAVLLFLLLAVLQFSNRNRLRNISMAIGIASYVFLAAMPLAVTVSGKISAVYTGGLRYSALRRIGSFQENYTAVASAAGTLGRPELRTRIILAVKGLNGCISGASLSWLLDLVVFPVALTWLLYRLGIFLANTLFGSFKIQKIGETLRRVFQRSDR